MQTTQTTQTQTTENKHAIPEALKRFPAAVQIAERMDQFAERVDHIAEQVEAARAKVRGEFHDQALRAQARLTDWQGVAVTLVEKAQGKARSEKDDVTQRVEELLAKLPTVKLQATILPGKLVQDRAAALLAAWLKLPSDVRDDVLTVAGVATARQTASVLEELAALRAELHAHFPQLETTSNLENRTTTSTRRKTRKDQAPAEA